MDNDEEAKEVVVAVVVVEEDAGEIARGTDRELIYSESGRAPHLQSAATIACAVFSGVADANEGRHP